MSAKKVKIEIDTNEAGPRIDENFFGLHLEHIWNCIYPCVWVGNDSDIPNIDGLRKETIDKLANLRPSVCKYPGGYFTDSYDWQDGIGPQSQRPRRYYPNTPGQVETNQFGTPEFIRFCQLIGAEPYLSVNTIGLTAREASYWVEYCNCDKDTFWTRERKADGFEKPIGVKYWSIGNEAHWLHSPETYAELYRKFGHYMLNMDPEITLVAACVEPGTLTQEPWNENNDWSERFCQITKAAQSFFLGPWHDIGRQREVLVSVHPYFSAKNTDGSPDVFYDHIRSLLTRLPDSISKAVGIFERTRRNYPRPKLCFDEYGLLFWGCLMNGNMTQPAPYWLALWLAAFYHICFDHSEYIGMIAHPGVINMEHELLVLENDTVVATPSYYVFKMLRAHGNGTRLKFRIDGVAINEEIGSSLLLVTATLNMDGKSITISVTNLDLERDYDLDLILNQTIREASAQELYFPDLEACNSASQPNKIAPQDSTIELKNNHLQLQVKPHSIITIQAKYNTPHKLGT